MPSHVGRPPDPEDIAGELREVMAVVTNATNLLALSRDEAAVGAVRGLLARQVERLAALSDLLSGGRGWAGPSPIADERE